MGQFNDKMQLICETNLEVIREVIERKKPDVVVIDSIQTMFHEDVSSAPGSVSQVRESTNILMRIADIVASVPSLLYVILIMMVLGANEVSILVGLCISGWIETARIVRGEVMRIKEREFVLASRLAGAGPLRIFLTHLLPNAAGPIVVSLTFLVPQAIFTEAFLSFMGVGIPAPRASLGTMIQAARSQIFVHPYQMLIPTAVLCILILSLNLIGAGLEAKIRRRREGM